MNKKDYIDAINEIKADDKLKKKTIEKLTTKKTKTYLMPKRILSAAAVFMLLFSFVYMNNNMKKENLIEENKPIAKLPTVGSYENMKAMVEKSNEKSRIYDYDTVFNEGSISNDTMKSAPEASIEKTEYSTTNVQVQGVDEADIVKTNGDYIFYYRKYEYELSIIDVKNNEVIKTIEYEDIIPSEMYLSGDKLIVMARYRQKEASKVRAITYSYRYTTKVIEYDISNINDIKTVREVEVEGSMVTSRMIGDYVYIVSNKNIYTDLLEDENLLKPRFKDTAIGEEEKCVEYEDIQYFPDTLANTYMMVSSFNIKDTNKPITVQTYLGNGDEVYASTRNLYVTCAYYTEVNEFMGVEYTTYQNSTKVYKFALNDGDVSYVADATVPGRVKNQFSMDEYNGYFRVATTYRSKETLYKDLNNLYVLDENLNLVGQLENLAPGESIYSVRYMGDKAYMVTFEQVDPLFVIDLSNPTNPKVLGQLKIPGYSDYLHPYDETHIIGFGKDTETDGELVKTKGFKMALFDVSDVSNPKELHSVKIGDSGTYSELLNNHKALLFSKEKNIIAFPITVRETQNNSKYYKTTTFRGAVIYGLSVNNGFEERARISHNEKNSVERIIYIGNNIYTLSQDLIKITDMSTMKTIGEIEL